MNTYVLIRSFDHYRSKGRRARLVYKQTVDVKTQLIPPPSSRVVDMMYNVSYDRLVVEYRDAQIDRDDTYSTCLMGWYSDGMFRYRLVVFRYSAAISTLEFSSVEAWDVLGMRSSLPGYRQNFQKELDGYKKSMMIRIRSNTVYWYIDDVEYDGMMHAYSEYDFHNDYFEYPKQRFINTVCTGVHQHMDDAYERIMSQMSGWVDLDTVTERLREIEHVYLTDGNRDRDTYFALDVRLVVYASLGMNIWWIDNILTPAYTYYMLNNNNKRIEKIDSIISSYVSLKDILIQVDASTVNRLSSLLNDGSVSSFLMLDKHKDELLSIISNGAIDTIRCIFNHIGIDLPIIRGHNEYESDEDYIYYTPRSRKFHATWWRNRIANVGRVLNRLIHQLDSRKEYLADINGKDENIEEIEKDNISLPMVYSRDAQNPSPYSISMRRNYSNYTFKIVVYKRYYSECDDGSKVAKRKVIGTRVIGGVIDKRDVYQSKQPDTIYVSVKLNSKKYRKLESFLNFEEDPPINDEDMEEDYGQKDLLVLYKIDVNKMGRWCDESSGLREGRDGYIGIDEIYKKDFSPISIVDDNNEVDETDSDSVIFMNDDMVVLLEYQRICYTLENNFKCTCSDIVVLDIDRNTSGFTKRYKGEERQAEIVLPRDNNKIHKSYNNEIAYYTSTPSQVVFVRNICIIEFEDLYSKEKDSMYSRDRYVLYHLGRNSISIADTRSTRLRGYNESGIEYSGLIVHRDEMYVYTVCKHIRQYNIMRVKNRRFVYSNVMKNINIVNSENLYRRSFDVDSGRGRFMILYTNDNIRLHDHLTIRIDVYDLVL